jgi:chemotaxis protein MotB
MLKPFLPIFAISILVACVPARRFEDISSQHKECADELTTIKSLALNLETENDELKESTSRMKHQVKLLTSDTNLLGKSLRIKEKQYDKIDLNNQRIQAQLEALQGQSDLENKKLIADLEKTKLELQKKEDELRITASELNRKKIDLDKISNDLKSREQRVLELEEIIANKDDVLKALKDKVANALLGFKDKGLTIEQKNGKVYISMEAKLLFGSGKTSIDANGKQALIELAKVLQEQEDLEVLVEGHTDSDKMKASSHPKDNWELSVLRATSVVKLMLKNSTINPSTISAAGRSQFLPLDPDDKAKNRRIEIILIPKLDELFEMISK